MGMRYSREDACRAWLTYAGLKSEFLCQILQKYGSCSRVYDRFLASDGCCLNAYITPEATQALRRQSTKEAMHAMLLTMQKHDMQIMCIGDEIYPASLRQMNDPPALLFYRGQPACMKARCVTMVGSRKASDEGLKASRRIARELSQAGVHIVSGLAIGIDSASLLGGLEGGTPVIGVMACGLDVNYPSGNSNLREQIVEQGGVLLSEYPPESPALAWHFPVRNRIMAGLGNVLLMMEASIRSGSMITVQHALEQGKDVYAYPGLSGTVEAEGAHQLLREGALFFSSAKDILEDQKWDAPVVSQASAERRSRSADSSVSELERSPVSADKPLTTKPSVPKQPRKAKGKTAMSEASAVSHMPSKKAITAHALHQAREKSPLHPSGQPSRHRSPQTEEASRSRGEPSLLPDLSPLQMRIYKLLDDGEKSFDQLAAETGLEAPMLFGALSMLQLTRLVAALPGKLYRQIHDDD